MPNSKKSRTKKVSPNTAGTARRNSQLEAAIANKVLRGHGIKTPWEKQKLARAIMRKRQGKTFENWMIAQAKKSKYKSQGKHVAA